MLGFFDATRGSDPKNAQVFYMEDVTNESELSDYADMSSPLGSQPLRSDIMAFQCFRLTVIVL